MTRNSKVLVEQTAFEIFAKGGYEALSMRELSKQSGVTLSSIYHYFADKDILLKTLFDKTNTELGQKRALLPRRRNAHAMLKDRIAFQFEHIASVVFVLKYYLHFRPEFLRLDSGYVPAKAYLHIDEVITVGLQTGEYNSKDPVTDAKIMAHAINGFLLEYYPDPPTGRELAKLVTEITDFLQRAMIAKGGGM